MPDNAREIFVSNLRFLMEEKGITTVPCLAIDEEVLDFGNAVKWVNGLEG